MKYLQPDSITFCDLEIQINRLSFFKIQRKLTDRRKGNNHLNKPLYKQIYNKLYGPLYIPLARKTLANLVRF